MNFIVIQLLPCHKYIYAAAPVLSKMPVSPHHHMCGIQISGYNPSDELKRLHRSRIFIKRIFHKIINTCISKHLSLLIICGNLCRLKFFKMQSRRHVKGKHRQLVSLLSCDSSGSVDKCHMPHMYSIEFSECDNRSVRY